MEELKMLIEMVAALPAMAIWVLVGFFAYKTVIIGSIYSVIRTGMTLLHSWATKPKQVEFTLHGVPISDTVAGALKGQIARLSNSDYLHASGVEKLRLALDIVEISAHDSSAMQECIQFLKDKKNARSNTTLK